MPGHPNRCATARSEAASGSDATSEKPVSGVVMSVAKAVTYASPVTVCDL